MGCHGSKPSCSAACAATYRAGPSETDGMLSMESSPDTVSSPRVPRSPVPAPSHASGPPQEIGGNIDSGGAEASETDAPPTKTDTLVASMANRGPGAPVELAAME